MKIKELKERDSSGKNRIYNYYTCDYCSAEYRKQKRFEGATQEHYCSKTCYSNDNTKVSLVCGHCGVTFLRKASRLENSKSGIYFCCREHKDLAQTYMKEIRPSHYGEGRDYRTLAFKHYPAECSVCRYSNKEALEVHHIDKDRNNNSIENLQILCANCHTLLHKGKLYGTAS